MQIYEAQGVPEVVPKAAVTPTICRLTIERFRGIENSVLASVRGPERRSGRRRCRQVHHPRRDRSAPQPHQPRRLCGHGLLPANIEAGFAIEAVMSLAPERRSTQQQAVLALGLERRRSRRPEVDDEGGRRRAVYSLRVRGTADLELLYEIVQPDGRPILPAACGARSDLSASAAMTVTIATCGLSRARRWTACCPTRRCARKHGERNSRRPTFGGRAAARQATRPLHEA